MDLLVSYSADTNPFEQMVTPETNLLSSLLSGVTGQLNGFVVFIATIVTLYALVQCYFGYIIFRITLVIQSVINGLGVGAFIGALISFYSGMIQNRIAIIIVLSLIGGIIGGIMTHFLHKFCVFYYYFFMVLIFEFIPMSITVVPTIGSSRDNTNIIRITIIIMIFLLSIIAGILGVLFERYIKIWTTSIGFGFIAGFTIGLMTVLWLGLTLALLFTVTGIIVQLYMTKKKKENKKKSVPQKPGAPQLIIYAQNGQFAQGQQYQLLYQGQPIYQQPQFQPTTLQSAAAIQKTCLNCNAPMEANAFFCGLCGARQYTAPASAPSIEKPVQYPSEYETMIFTPSSENVHDMPSESVTAPDNNTAFEAPMFCPSCGTKLDIPGAIFCDSCGSRIE